MELIGYARVSTSDQNLDSQLNQLTLAGCRKLFMDIGTGKKFGHPQLMQALEYMREGDILVVSDIDRVGRGPLDLLKFIEDLGKRKIEFKSLSQPIDTTTPIGKLLYTIRAAFAELEANLISERTKRGLENARARGRIGGRPTVVNDQLLMTAKIMIDQQKLSFRQVAEYLGVSRSTIFVHLKKYTENNAKIVTT